MNDKTYTAEELERLKSRTDQRRLDKMSEEEIERNARSDPDALPPDDEQLKQFKKVRKHDAEKK